MLLLVSLVGFIVPNGVFLWAALTDADAIRAALSNPIAFAFFLEAVLLMGLFAWLIHRSGRRPGWLAFIVMSLAGSLAFSVPAWIWLNSRRSDAPSPAKPI